MSITKAFSKLKRRNRALFTIIVAAAIILFWKGIWGLWDVLFDEIIFQQHLIWSNLIAAIIGIIILTAAGFMFDRLV